jgi:transcriptional regulator with XRE-family HTH domain
MMGNELGEIIRDFRLRKKISPGQIVNRLRQKHISVESVNTISQWESGALRPDEQSIEALATILRLEEDERNVFFKTAGRMPQNHSFSDGQHDHRIFQIGESIFAEGELRELINHIYSCYQYRETQAVKLVQLADFLAGENNRYLKPELVVESKKLNLYLNNFSEFLKSNFYQSTQSDNGDSLFLLQDQATSFETEAFLTEFQMISMDVEKAYRNYRALVLRSLSGPTI